MKTLRRFVAAGAVAALALSLTLALAINAAFADTPPLDDTPQNAAAVAQQTWPLAIGAAISVAAGCLGAAYAVGRVGAAVMGAASEKPEILTRALVFVALGEGIAILGLVIAVLLVLRIPG